MFTVLLDAPAKPVSRIQIAKLGTFNDKRYGDFDITAENVANWQRNLSKLPGGEALIDFEHRSERKPRDSKAAGWISGIDLDGDKVMADTRWTPGGRDAIETETYRFISPVFGPALGADNVQLDDALPSVALTNKPVLGMPAVMLASVERVSEAIDEDPALRFHMRALDGDYGDVTQALVMLDIPEADRKKAAKAGEALPDGSYPIRNGAELHSAAVLAASGHGDAAGAKKLIRKRAGDLGVTLSHLPGFADDQPAASKQMSAPASADSRPPDMPNEDLIKLLDLGDDADDAKLLEAITALKAKADTPEPTVTEPAKTLEQQAAENGQVLLDADTLNTLKRQASAGETAMHQLHEQRFETAFELALNHSEGAKVTPAEKDSLHHFFTLDADATIKLIEDRDPIVSARPAGAPTVELDGDTEPQVLAANGVHPGNHNLHAQITKHMLDNKIPTGDYAKVMEQYVAGTVVL